jgi:hypothetical protein
MPSQWDGSSLTLSTRPRAAPQPSPSSISFPPPHPRSKTYKTIATPSPSLSLLQPNQARTTRHQVEELEGTNNGRRELQRRRAQARRGSAAGCRRRLIAGEAGAAGRARGPPRRSARPGGRLRRHGHHRVGQGHDLR